MKAIFISILILANISIAQKAIKYNENISISPETDLKQISQFDKNSSKINKEKDLNYRLKILNLNYSSIKHPENNSFDILGNFGDNISFGGFYESFAILNFTPQLNIKPTGFLNIYANHYLNVLIPLSRAKDVSNSILLNSVSMIALEYVTDLFFRNDNWLAQIAEFAIKNCILNLSLKPGLKNVTANNDSILQFDNYYYSFSIVF